MTVKKKKQADRPRPYSESEVHVPNPMYQTGVVDTSGITGAEAARVESISPIFGRARAEALAHAVDVLDNDPDAVEGLVVFPESDRTRDEAEAHLRGQAEAARRDHPVPDQTEVVPEQIEVVPNRAEDEDSGLA